MHELRQRLFYIVLSVGTIAIVTYFVQQRVVNILLRPTHGQQFIYTSPGGGINFLFQVCVYLGIAISIPVIVYQLLRYIEPLITENSRRFIVVGSIISGILALAGMVFGYYVGLPAVLHFLLHQFVTKQIHPLLTIQSYISFVMVYMVGSAMLFQAPLILLFINRIKPLQPRKLLHAERWVILGAFLVSGIMNPTPQIFSQLAVAGPVILMYQFGILLVWAANRKKTKRRPKKVLELLEHDAQAQAERLAHARSAQLVTAGSGLSQAAPVAAPIAAPAVVAAPAPTRLPRQSIAPATRPVVKRRFYAMDVRPYRIAQPE